SSLIAWRAGVDQALAAAHLDNADAHGAGNHTGWMFSLNSDNDCVHPNQFMVLPQMPTQFIDNRGEYAKRYRNCNPPFYARELQYFSEY
ncbi:hypothetical protein ABTF80_20535, partial [Acinetobacter baumannii]